MKHIIRLFVLMIAFTACTSKEAHNPKAIELNNKAIELNKFNQKPDSALILLDQAIAIDSTYYLAHVNKASIFLHQKEYDRAIEETNTAIKLNPDYIGGWEFIGIIYDMKGDTIKALENYKKCLGLYNIQKTGKMDKKQLVSHKMNIAFLLVLTKDTAGLKKIHKELKVLDSQNPSIDSVITMSREEFLSMYQTSK